MSDINLFVVDQYLISPNFPFKNLSESKLRDSLTNFVVVSSLSVRQSIPYISFSEIFSLRPDEFHGDVVVRPDRRR